MVLKEFAQSAQSLLQDELARLPDAGTFSAPATRDALARFSMPWSRETLVLMSPGDILALAAPDDELQPGTNASFDDFPVLRLRRDDSNPSAVRVAGEKHLDVVAALMKRGVERVAVVLSFDDSPGRADDGFWSLMTEAPCAIYGRSENHDNVAAMPELPVTATSLGLDADIARAVGAACDAVNAVAMMSPRTPEVSTHPAGDMAEQRAGLRDPEVLFNMSTERRFKSAWALVQNNPELAVVRQERSLAA